MESTPAISLRATRTSATDALGHTQSQSWTANSDVQTTTNGLKNSTTSDYDNLDNLISTKLPTGAETTIGYASTAHPHLPTSVTDPQGNTVSRDYDAAGNVTVIHSDGLDTDLRRLTYDKPHGTLDTVTDGNGHVTSYDHDNVGNLITVTRPQPQGATHYTYDSLSRVTSVTDGRGVRIDYAYDRLDRVVAITKHSDGTVLETVTYDANGDRTRLETPRETHIYTYQPGGLLTSDTRKAASGTESITYGYDLAGNLTSLSGPGGKATYAYDAANRLTTLTDPGGQATSFDYDKADHRTSTTWPGAGKETLEYDASGRQTSLTVTDTGGTQLLHTANSYTTSDGADSSLIQSHTRGATTHHYNYDALNRLTRATQPTIDYDYDPAGNRTRVSGYHYHFNAADELTKSGDGLAGHTRLIGYDKAGNHTSATNPDNNHTAQSSYSPTGQWVSQTTPDGPDLTLTYDTTGTSQLRSITATENGNTTRRVFTHTALGVTSITTNGHRAVYTRDPNGTPITEHAAGSRYNVITNRQGSVVALLGTDGTLAATYQYWPSGKTRTQSGDAADATRLRYLGKYHVENSGPIHTGRRWLLTQTGRFSQPDPTHQDTNPYTYAHNNPINNTDPTGTSIFSIFHHVVKDVFSCLGGAGAALEQFGPAVAASTAASGFGVAAGEVATGLVGCGLGVAGTEVIGQNPFSPGPGPA